MTTIGILLLTLNGEKHLEKLLPPLLGSPLKLKLLAIDSESQDNSVKILKEKGFEVLTCERSAFNHGLTRERGRKHLATDIVVCLTQDAYFHSPEDLERLLSPLIEKEASVSYARQTPRKNASLFEAFPRRFNYPETSHIRCLKDVPEWGVYTFFISNSAAAWRNSALDEIGGFKEIVFGEDTLALAELLHRGHKVAYQAESLVEHSHRFTLAEEYKRNTLIGRSRNQMASLLSIAGKDSRRGKAFAKALLKEALKKPWLLPYAFLHLGAKWFGYRRGYSI